MLRMLAQLPRGTVALISLISVSISKESKQIECCALFFFKFSFHENFLYQNINFGGHFISSWGMLRKRNCKKALSSLVEL